jgi:hypothetical protein
VPRFSCHLGHRPRHVEPFERRARERSAGLTSGFAIASMRDHERHGRRCQALILEPTMSNGLSSHARSP